MSYLQGFVKGEELEVQPQPNVLSFWKTLHTCVSEIFNDFFKIKLTQEKTEVKVVKLQAFLSPF